MWSGHGARWGKVKWSGWQQSLVCDLVRKNTEYRCYSEGDWPCRYYLISYLEHLGRFYCIRSFVWSWCGTCIFCGCRCQRATLSLCHVTIWWNTGGSEGGCGVRWCTAFSLHFQKELVRRNQSGVCDSKAVWQKYNEKNHKERKKRKKKQRKQATNDQTTSSNMLRINDSAWRGCKSVPCGWDKCI